MDSNTVSLRRLDLRWASLVLMLLGVSLAPDVARADIRLWQDDEDPVRYFDVTGYVQPGYIARVDDPRSPLIQDNNFWLHRARFGFRTQLYPWLRMRLELETTPNPSLNDAYLDFLFDPAFNVRAGQFQLAFLRTFQFSESQLGFIDRTLFVPTSPDRSFLRYLSPRDIGLMATGRVGDQERGPTLEYWVGAFLGRGSNQTRDVDNALLLSARAELHLFGVPEGASAESDLARNERARLAVAGAAYSNCDDRAQFNRGFTVDTELRYQGILASAAFVRFANGSSNGLGDALGYGGDDACGADESSPVPTHVAWGASAQLQYVLPEALFPVTGQALEVLARWDVVDPNSPADGSLFGGDSSHDSYDPPPSYADTDSPPSQYRLTFGLNWFPTSEQRLRLSANYQHRIETEDVFLMEDARLVRSVGIDNDILWLQLTAGL